MDFPSLAPYQGILTPEQQAQVQRAAQDAYELQLQNDPGFRRMLMEARAAQAVGMDGPIGTTGKLPPDDKVSPGWNAGPPLINVGPQNGATPALPGMLPSVPAVTDALGRTPNDPNFNIGITPSLPGMFPTNPLSSNRRQDYEAAPGARPGTAPGAPPAATPPAQTTPSGRTVEGIGPDVGVSASYSLNGPGADEIARQKQAEAEYQALVEYAKGGDLEMAARRRGDERRRREIEGIDPPKEPRKPDEFYPGYDGRLPPLDPGAKPQDPGEFYPGYDGKLPIPPGLERPPYLHRPRPPEGPPEGFGPVPDEWMRASESQVAAPPPKPPKQNPPAVPVGPKTTEDAVRGALGTPKKGNAEPAGGGGVQLFGGPKRQQDQQAKNAADIVGGNTGKAASRVIR